MRLGRIRPEAAKKPDFLEAARTTLRVDRLATHSRSPFQIRKCVLKVFTDGMDNQSPLSVWIGPLVVARLLELALQGIGNAFVTKWHEATDTIGLQSRFVPAWMPEHQHPQGLGQHWKLFSPDPLITGIAFDCFEWFE